MTPINIKHFRGETFSVGELIKSLKQDKGTIDMDIAPITIHTDDYSGEVCAIYKCCFCDKVHLLANNFDNDNELLFDKKEIVNMMDEGNEVYAIDKSLTKREVLTALKKTNKDFRIAIETIADESCYNLAGIYKCDDCATIILDNEYDIYSPSLN